MLFYFGENTAQAERLMSIKTRKEQITDENNM